jgi:hypothetical protein
MGWRVGRRLVGRLDVAVETRPYFLHAGDGADGAADCVSLFRRDWAIQRHMTVVYLHRDRVLMRNHMPQNAMHTFLEHDVVCFVLTQSLSGSRDDALRPLAEIASNAQGSTTRLASEVYSRVSKSMPSSIS